MNTFLFNLSKCNSLFQGALDHPMNDIFQSLCHSLSVSITDCPQLPACSLSSSSVPKYWGIFVLSCAALLPLWIWSPEMNQFRPPNWMPSAKLVLSNFTFNSPFFLKLQTFLPSLHMNVYGTSQLIHGQTQTLSSELFPLSPFPVFLWISYISVIPNQENQTNKHHTGSVLKFHQTYHWFTHLDCSLLSIPQ